jgi:hypothetical protein
MQCAVDPTITSELSEDDSGYEYEYDEHETEVGILLLTLFWNLFESKATCFASEFSKVLFLTRDFSRGNQSSCFADNQP